MGSFSIWHWVITLVLLAALVAFVYLITSLLRKGARTASKGKLAATVILLPVAALAVFAIIRTAGSPAVQKPSPADHPNLAANYATCLLDKLPGTQNDVAANATMQVCVGKHPGGMAAVKQGSGRGMFGHDSGAECTAQKAGDTRSNQAAYLIGMACRKLYDEADWWKKGATPVN